MARRYLTQIFPRLRPLRQKQRLFCFYAAMRLDRRHYARTRRSERLPWRLFASGCPMYNTRTGRDMTYQENKVFNLHLAARQIDGLLIQPGETFSFCLAVRHADRETPYREALSEVYGELVAEEGGGLCMMSNLLFWLFLHTPMTIVERHGHRKKDFPEPPSDAPMGTDATVAAGWLDLKVRNDTDLTFQIGLDFDRENIYGSICCDRDCGPPPVIVNGPVCYRREGEAIFEEVDVIRRPAPGEAGGEEVLYRNRCQIGYELPDTAEIREGKEP